ncbi:MAG: hypothetical protein DKM22_04210 [Candidatus Melainabacteria bacterium]|jgi:hypothetical protein|nr:MAG: hypothetical protein DKM22_04210 [Candidatus Melainabacteria bacterium]
MKTNLNGVFVSTKLDGSLIPYLEGYRIAEFIGYLQDQNVLYLYPVERKSIVEYLNDFIDTLEDK